MPCLAETKVSGERLCVQWPSPLTSPETESRAEVVPELDMRQTAAVERPQLQPAPTHCNAVCAPPPTKDSDVPVELLGVRSGLQISEESAEAAFEVGDVNEPLQSTSS